MSRPIVPQSPLSCQHDTNELWPGEGDSLNGDALTLAQELRKLARLLIRMIRRGSALEKAQALAYVAHRLENQARKIRIEYGESFEELARAGMNRELGNSILGDK